MRVRDGSRAIAYHPNWRVGIVTALPIGLLASLVILRLLLLRSFITTAPPIAEHLDDNDRGTVVVAGLRRQAGLLSSRGGIRRRRQRSDGRSLHRCKTGGDAADLDVEDADTVATLIQRSYANGERPLSPGIFEPNDLLSAIPRSTR